MIAFPTNPTNRKWLLAIIVIAAILRCGAMFFFHPSLVSDDRDYDRIARSIVRGEGYKLDGKPTAYRLPGYPLVLAATYALFGDSKAPIRILQTASDLLSCLLLFGIGKKLFSEKVGFVAAAALALFPIQILYVSQLMTETLFTTILLLIIWLALREEKESQSVRNHLILGALIGVGTLIRPTMLPFPLLIFLWRWRGGIPFKANLRSTALVVFALFLVISPWLIRNYAEFHRISLTSNSGVNFWVGNHSGASGAFSFPKENNPLFAVEDDFERSDLGMKLGIEFIESKPVEYCVLLGKKFVRFFSADYWLMMTMQYKPEWASAPNFATVFTQLSVPVLVVLHLPYVVVLFLGTFGLVCNAAEDEKKFFVLRSLLVYWLFIHLVIFADARLRFPILPMVILAASYGWWMLRANTFGRTKLRIAVVSILCLLFIGGWIGEYVAIRSKMIPTQARSEMKAQCTHFSAPSALSSSPALQKCVDFVAPLEYI
jgi:4-amino-4-deoxy-L-arabinose transferase-like glycosyltransferase